MMLRILWFPLFLICLGCQGLETLEPEGTSVAATALWEQGQAAMREGQAARAIDLYEQSLAADPAFTRNHMSLAAAYLESGKEVEACAHLGTYVAAHPEHLVIRTHYAELLLRLNRVQEGCAEYERFIADMQDQQEEDLRALIHGHSRLMEVGEATEDEYAVHLHRGIGLYLLAHERAGTDEPEGDLPTEGLLCKAAGELSVAHTLRPEEARPCWYLHTVWSRLGQQQPAGRSLREAGDAAPFSYLTPAEQRSLQLASRGPESDSEQR